jgi:hypothetical protein
MGLRLPCLRTRGRRSNGQRLDEWLVAMEGYVRELQADRAGASAATPPCPFCAAAAAARAARGCILLDAVPVCRACFLRDGHTTMTVQHIDGELQLKAHTLALATLRVAEAEGARWCAPRLSVYECRRCSLHVPDPRSPLCAHALSCDCSLCAWASRDTNKAPRSGLPTEGPTVV